MSYQPHTLVDHETVLDAKLISEMEDGIAGAYFVTDNSILKLNEGMLSINTVNKVNDETANNACPITAAAVNTAIGNIDVLLQTI